MRSKDEGGRWRMAEREENRKGWKHKPLEEERRGSRTRVGATAARFATEKRWKQPKCASVDEQLNEMWVSIQWDIIRA